MVETRGSRRFAILFLVAAFVVLLLGRWLHPFTDVALTVEAPFASVFNSAANSVGDGLSGLLQGPSLRDQNQQLRKTIALLVQRNAALQQFQHEDAILHRMLNFETKNPRVRFAVARVIADTPGGLTPEIIINLGRINGLLAGMTVVDQNGYFVGQITELDSRASKVQLLTNPSSSVGAIDLHTRAVGLVDGEYGAAPQFSLVITSDSVQSGDLIMTSGQYNLFPRNLIIGQVTAVSRQNVSLFQTARIQPAADLSHLETVQVIRSFTPSKPVSLLSGQ